jgi:hypothetical protein
MDVVWIRDWPPRQATPATPEPPAQPKERTSPQEGAARTPTPSVTRTEPEVRAVPPPAPRARATPRRSAPSQAPAGAGSAPAPIQGHIDFDAERRLAFEQISREQAREDRFSTFSFNDLVHKPPPEDPDPLEHLFDGSGGGSSSGPSVLGVGQARTKVGRFLSSLCNALTGGFGVSLQGHNIMSVCARDTTGPYAASPLRPDYLKKLPVCEETVASTEARLASAALPSEAPASAAVASEALAASDDPPRAISTIKCRLLDEKERAEYWKHAAERLEQGALATVPAQGDVATVPAQGDAAADAGTLANGSP